MAFNPELLGFVFKVINQKPESADKSVKALVGNKNRQLKCTHLRTFFCLHLSRGKGPLPGPLPKNYRAIIGT